MHIQTRKLNLIEFILKLKDKKAFAAIEKTIVSISRSSDQELKRFTKEDLINRAEARLPDGQESNADYKTGKYKSQEQLEDVVKNW